MTSLTPLLLRDLKNDLRETEGDFIRKNRPDLVEAMENGDDITIGGYYKVEDYKAD